ncbi:MAG: glycosyltransferase [Thermoplasmata archaeon]|nr:glycosyltransferase [Thermoplasmata archaeon]
MKLLIISNMSHYLRHDRIVGWGPTVQEIDYLSNIFQEIRHIACLHQGPAPLSSLPYRSERINLIPVPATGGDDFFDKLGILRAAPIYLKKILHEISWADMIHIRCPANIPLLSIILLTLLPHPKFRWVKFAGNWKPEGDDPWSYAFQRWWLRKGIHRGIVTVNGRWPDQPSHVYSFLNPCLSLAELKDSAETHKRKELKFPLNLLFVGRVETAKGVGRVLQIAENLAAKGIGINLHIVGDGPERPAFQKFVENNGLSPQVIFHGWLPKPALADFYSQAHFFILPSSASEGWPKVVSEAMAYGAVPLAGAVSSIPQILAASGAGKALPPLDIDAFVEAILAYIKQPECWQEASQAGMAAAPRFTYEYYLQALRQTFQAAWGITLPKIRETMTQPGIQAPHNNHYDHSQELIVIDKEICRGVKGRPGFSGER